MMPGGTIGLPLEMGWDASRLFADEANIVSSSGYCVVINLGCSKKLQLSLA